MAIGASGVAIMGILFHRIDDGPEPGVAIVFTPLLMVTYPVRRRPDAIIMLAARRRRTRENNFVDLSPGVSPSVISSTGFRAQKGSRE